MVKKRKQLKVEKAAAFETIVSEYETGLLRYVARILNHHEIAQDVVQDTFIKLFRKWEEDLMPSPKISSWLYRVAHNCAVDYLRKETRHLALHQNQSLDKQQFVMPDRGDGFQISAEAAKAAKALNVLDMRERQLVVLKVYEEKSYREINEITGLTVSNVGYILHHAMKKMAAELKRAKTI